MRYSTVVSLWDVLEINGQAFMRAVMEARRVQDVIEHLGDDEQRKEAVGQESRPVLLAHATELAGSIQALYARAASISTLRLMENLQHNEAYSWNDLRLAMADIESRLKDELGLVKLFVMDPNQLIYLAPGAELMGQVVADRFPSLLFEMEEAARCVALGRATASAFHSMRALEITIRALATFLGIPDPTKPAERNWGYVLGEIKTKIDAKYPMKARLPETEGAKVEALYVTLDAIKNPWRNATMHTENVYQPHEANHILQCVNMFICKVAEVCDENGEPV